jgi:hypothetical protein
MSRTYRRKNSNWDMQWDLYDYVKEQSVHGGYYFYRKKITTDHPEYQKIVNRYHSDKNRFRNAVPSWFVNLFCERKMRRMTRHEIRKWMNNPDNHEAMVPEFIRDAGWKYY